MSRPALFLALALGLAGCRAQPAEPAAGSAASQGSAPAAAKAPASRPAAPSVSDARARELLDEADQTDLPGAQVCRVAAWLRGRPGVGFGATALGEQRLHEGQPAERSLQVAAGITKGWPAFLTDVDRLIAQAEGSRRYSRRR